MNEKWTFKKLVIGLTLGLLLAASILLCNFLILISIEEFAKTQQQHSPEQTNEVKE